jgi:hypothetical protein
MKKYLYDIVFFSGLAIWLGGSAYYGWNKTATDVGKKFTDALGTILMVYGLANSFVRGIKTEVNVNYHSPTPSDDKQ